MKIKALLIFIILLLAGGGGLTVWHYWPDTTLMRNVKPVFTPPPLRHFTNQISGTLTRAGVIEETNRHRDEFGLIALRENELLNQAAEAKANDILAEQYFDHVSPEGLGPSDVVDTTGYAYLSVGENLALGNFKDDEDIVQAWMDSPGHRENILKAGFTEIGVAVITGEFENQKAWVGVQMFALPQSACPTPNLKTQSRFEKQKNKLDAKQAELREMKNRLDNEVAVLQKMQAEIQDLANRGRARVEEGNEDMRRGNEIYEETGSREQAQPYWDSGEAKQEEGQALLERARQKEPAAREKLSEVQNLQISFNQKVADSQKYINDLQYTAGKINAQVQIYNDCLEEYR